MDLGFLFSKVGEWFSRVFGWSVSIYGVSFSIADFFIFAFMFSALIILLRRLF